MTHDEVQNWLDRYVDAWRANQADPILSLFTDDATYRYRPYHGPELTVVGSKAIADSWLEEPDDPDSWEAHYEPYAVDGDRAVAVGESRYPARGDRSERVYSNAYLLRFAPDGRCAEFTEFYMLHRHD